MTNEERLAEIQERLNRVKPGPWRWLEQRTNQRHRNRRGNVKDSGFVYLLTRPLSPFEHHCEQRTLHWSDGPSTYTWCDDDRCMGEYEALALMRLNWYSIKRNASLYNVSPHSGVETLIENAPSDIAFLLDVIRDLQSQLEAKSC